MPVLGREDSQALGKGGTGGICLPDDEGSSAPSAALPDPSARCIAKSVLYTDEASLAMLLRLTLDEARATDEGGPEVCAFVDVESREATERLPAEATDARFPAPVLATWLWLPTGGVIVPEA